MDKYLKQYLNQVQATKSVNTYKTYSKALLDIWFPKGKTDLRLEYITSVIQDWNCSPNTKALRCNILKNYIEFYRNYKGLMNNNSLLVLLNSFKPKETVPEIATVEQYKAISELAAAKDMRISICIDLMFQNGLRSDEMVNIRTENYDANTATIIIANTKNHNDYKLLLTKELNIKISRYVAEHKSDWLLTTRNNTKMDLGYIRKVLKDICIEAGFPDLHCHSFRHGSAVTLLDNNVNLFVIKEHLRHKSLQSTQRYLHINSKHKTEVQNIFGNIC